MFEVIFGDLKTFLWDMLSILTMTWVLFLFVKPIFIHDKEIEDERKDSKSD